MDSTATADFLSLPAPEQARRMADVARAALRHWRMDGEPVLVQHRENAVFRVDRPDGPAALRVHRQGYHSDASLRSELAWMQALRGGGLAVPAPIPAADGSLFAKAGAAGTPGLWQVDLLDWMDGVALGRIGRTLELPGQRREPVFRALGAFAARLHNLSQGWARPAWFRRHAWDLDGLTGPAPLWGRYWQADGLSAAEAGLLRRAGAAARDELAALGEAGGYGLIHADMLPENVLVDGAEVCLVDFDDAGFGWHLFELATALFWHRGEPDYPALAAALLEGYRAHRPLSEQACAALPLFMLLRGLSYVGWQHTRGQLLTPTLAGDVLRLADAYLAAREGGLHTRMPC